MLLFMVGNDFWLGYLPMAGWLANWLEGGCRLQQDVTHKNTGSFCLLQWSLCGQLDQLHPPVLLWTSSEHTHPHTELIQPSPASDIIIIIGYPYIEAKLLKLYMVRYIRAVIYAHMPISSHTPQDIPKSLMLPCALAVLTRVEVTADRCTVLCL